MCDENERRNWESKVWEGKRRRIVASRKEIGDFVWKRYSSRDTAKAEN